MTGGATMVRAVALLFALVVAGCGPTSSAKQVAAALLKDPSSAQFEDVKAVKGVACGRINGKNSYGAYSGFKRFIVKDGVAAIEPTEGYDAANFLFQWSAECIG